MIRNGGEMRKSHQDRRWSANTSDNDTSGSIINNNDVTSGTSRLKRKDGSTILTVINRLENNRTSNFTSKNVFRIDNKDEKKNMYFGPSSSGSGSGVKIYIKNENNITNYNGWAKKSTSSSSGHREKFEPSSSSSSSTTVEPIIMPSFNRNRPKEFRSFRSCVNPLAEDNRRSYPSNQTQRAMSFLKKDLLSNRNDFTLSKKPSTKSTSNTEPIIQQPMYRTKAAASPASTPRVPNEFQREFPDINPSSGVSLRRNFTELVRHRPWKPIKILESRHVQTEPPPPPPQPVTATKSSHHYHTSTDLPLLRFNNKKQQNSQTSTTDSSMFLKKQADSSNFSMFKGMNSNDLYNYIDDVINQFRAKTNMLIQDDDDDDDDATQNLTEFSNTIFYPEDREMYRNVDDEVVNLRSGQIIQNNGRIRRFDRIALQDLSTILSSDNEEAVNGMNQGGEAAGDYVESRSFSKEEVNDDDLEVDAESSTFINYTHSFEIDDVSDLLDNNHDNNDEDGELDETLEES